MSPNRKQINLYQAEFRPPRIVLPTRSLLLGVAAFTAGLLGLHAWDSWKLGLYQQEAQRMSERAERVERQLEQAARGGRQADPHVVAEAEALEARVHALQFAQEAMAGGELGSETGYAAQFLALSRATVPGAWLTRIEISNRGRAMNLEGRVLHGEDPARLIAALGRQPLFMGLSYAALNVQPPKDEETPGDAQAKPAQARGFLEFSLSAHVPGAKAADMAGKADGGGT